MRPSVYSAWAFVNCFNPRICKRCDDSILPKWLTYRVSIHASVKDATSSLLKPFAKSRVSIHASVKDATTFRPLRLLFRPCFNPRICKRCDRYAIGLKEEAEVSIHASVKDATIGIRYIKRIKKVSIHASVKDATEKLKF